MSNIKDIVMENADLKVENDLYKRYIKYLRDWYHDHSKPEYEGMEPASFEEFIDNEVKEGLY
jgi:hypothetical protein